MSKKKTIIGAALTVIAVVLGSKVLGFLRQVIIASSYGANYETDIYFMSSDFVTGLSSALIASLITALVTVYIDISVKKSKKEANTVASKMLLVFLMIGGALALFANLFAPQLARLLAPDFSDTHLLVLIKYLRMFSVAFLFTAMQSVFVAVLNANNSFAPSKFYGLLFNPLAIVLVLLFHETLGINALVIAFFAANIGQILLLWFLSRKDFRFIPAFDLRDGAIKHLLFLSLPLLVGNIFIQLNMAIDKAICSTLGEGIASNYYYANTLEQFVTTTITATLSLILLSKYASYVAKGDTPMVIKTFQNSLSGLVLLLAPLTAVVMVSARDIVEIVYMRGEFDAVAAEYTAKALIGFAPGFALVAVREMYIRLHYSYQDTKLPMVAAILSCILNAGLSFAFAKVMGIIGVSLATSGSVILTIWMLNRSIKKYLPDFRLLSLGAFFLKVLPATLLGGGAAYLVAWLMEGAPAILRFGLGAVVCGGIYLLALFLLRCEELTSFIKELKEQIKAKLKRA